MFKIGSEAYEQEIVVNWLEINNYKFTAIPNDTYTKSWKQKTKNKKIWVRPWMSDLIIVLKIWAILFLEMKKKRWPNWWANGTQVSEHQKGWEMAINRVKNCEYIIAYWADEAIDIIKKLDN